MSADLTSTIRAAFASSFRAGQARVHELAASVPETQFWTRPYPMATASGTSSFI
jgi:hypothetical protein